MSSSTGRFHINPSSPGSCQHRNKKEKGQLLKAQEAAFPLHKSPSLFDPNPADPAPFCH